MNGILRFGRQSLSALVFEQNIRTGVCFRVGIVLRFPVILDALQSLATVERSFGVKHYISFCIACTQRQLARKGAWKASVLSCDI